VQPSFLTVPLWLTGVDAMSTARVALVPEKGDRRRPAWPRALEVLRKLQLPDGGWGEPVVYLSYDRFGSTLAALRALLEWGHPQDADRIGRGRVALEGYARDLGKEDRDLLGFEFITDRLLHDLQGFGISVDPALLSHLARNREQRLAYLGSLEVDPARPRSWWFSMEFLPDDTLARIDPSILHPEGGILASVGATAGYLRAVRLAGGDNPAAVHYLETVMDHSQGGAGIVWPCDTFQLIWCIDAYLRVGLRPDDPLIRGSIRELHRQWQDRPAGIGYSTFCPVRDGDDVSMGYSVLRRAGYEVSDEPLVACWNGRVMEAFPGERVNALSANVAALYALRDASPRRPIHDDMARSILGWLRNQIAPGAPLIEAFHLSPTYVLGRGIDPFLDYDPALAGVCVDRLLEAQRPDGGWGYGEVSTEEETCLAVIGLLSARRGGIARTEEPLRRAAGFLRTHEASDPWARPRLWLGKTLYLPVNVAAAYAEAARMGLDLAGLQG
jgi:hypothetical protein